MRLFLLLSNAQSTSLRQRRLLAEMFARWHTGEHGERISIVSFSTGSFLHRSEEKKIYV